jgi:trk system potassium uptake protein TrkA
MHVIIVGCGRMGSGIARALSLQGHSPVVIDHDAAAFQRLGASYKGKSLLGHGMDRTVLGHAGISHADALAAVTGNDNLNTIVALLARRKFHVPKVVARLFDPAKAETYRRLGVVTIAPTDWGITRVCEQLLHPRLNSVATVGDGGIDILEIDVPPSFVGRTLAELTIPWELQAVALRRDGRTFLADQNTRLQAEDVAYMAASSNAVERLSAHLGIA